LKRKHPSPPANRREFKAPENKHPHLLEFDAKAIAKGVFFRSGRDQRADQTAYRLNT